MISTVVLVSGVQQSDSVMHMFLFFKLFFHLDFCIILNRVLCAMQQRIVSKFGKE